MVLSERRSDLEGVGGYESEPKLSIAGIIIITITIKGECRSKKKKKQDDDCWNDPNDAKVQVLSIYSIQNSGFLSC